MNEASNFCNGVCYPSEQAKNPVLNRLPYLPTGRSLETKSITLDAKHYNGDTELDVHSMFGAYMVRATHEWFKANNKRTMIIERSAFAGTGKFASRWLGDNFSQQEYMGYSVTGVMQHNIIGIPLAGSDICGFIFDTNAELCARWYTLGAFYPFSRNHNNWGQIPQEPWVWDGIVYESSTTFLNIIQRAMYTKFHMIRYYYTELTMSSLNGGAFFKPLFMEFPDDNGSLDAPQELNIMLGSAMKLSINSNTLDKNTTDFYFPQGTWCSLLKAFADKTCFSAPAGGMTQTWPTKAYDKYLHLRQGFIAPMQDGLTLATTNKARTTKDLQQYPVDFHLVPSCTTDCTAEGRYLNDDGVTLDQTNNVNIYSLSYSHSNASETEQPAKLTVTVKQTATASNFKDNIVNQNDVLQNIHIMYATALRLNTGTYNVNVYKLDKSQVTLADAKYDATFDRLSFSNDKPDEPIQLPNIDRIEFTLAQ